MLIKLGIRYDENRALKIAEDVMKFIQENALKKSIDLGINRGSFPNFSISVYRGKVPAMRNATRTAIAPTGTISLIAGVSSSIEPLFSIYYKRKIENIGICEYFHPLLAEQLENRGINAKRALEKARNLKNPKEIIPDDLAHLYITAFEIEPEWHLKIQATFQKYVDNAVSKTINLPENATIEDVKKIFLLAYELKCKGITVYRYNSRKTQVINIY
ncbi:MAG: ribonucleoside reductase class II, partial [Promethearchaeota archaeon]